MPQDATLDRNSNTRCSDTGSLFVAQSVTELGERLAVALSRAILQINEERLSGRAKSL